MLFFSCGRSPFRGDLLDNTLNIQIADSEKITTKILGEYEYQFIGSSFVLYNENQAKIKIKRLDHQSIPLELSDIEVYLWMPDHGHGSYPINANINLEGDILLSDVYFTMPGRWLMIVKEVKTDKSIFWPIIL